MINSLVTKLKDFYTHTTLSVGQYLEPHVTGVSLSLQGKYADAVKFFDEAIAKDPNSILSHANRALSLDKLGKTELALDSVRTIKKILSKASTEELSQPNIKNIAAAVKNVNEKEITNAQLLLILKEMQNQNAELINEVKQLKNQNNNIYNLVKETSEGQKIHNNAVLDALDELDEKIQVKKINAVFKVEYKNELLNHKEMIDYCLEHGFSRSAILDLSVGLDRDLVTKAVEDNNLEVILAGLMSLESNI